VLDHVVAILGESGSELKKGRARANALSDYRRLMREIRAVYDPFTARHCPGCTTPCCMRPSRLTPLDVSIALTCGHKFAAMSDDEAHGIAVDHAAQRLALPMADEEFESPCEMLDKGRCSFPDDLRPFGCTTYICQPMYRNMPEADLRKLKRLVRLLTEAHERILHAVGREAAD